MKNSGIVLAELPRAGLGNKMLVWAQAEIFGHINSLKVYSTNWVALHIGPYLRKEKNKRFYYGYVKVLPLLDRLKLVFYKTFCNNIVEPEIKKINGTQSNNIYIFNKFPHDSDFFKEIRNHRSFIKDAIYSSLISEKVKEELDTCKSPEIGVHVRMGDFRNLNSNESWKNDSALRTPLSYFINQIENISVFTGKMVKVTLFSDGHTEELKPILALPNLEISTMKSDMADLLLLSKSKVIITSFDSTFGYWSAFLSDAIIFHFSSSKHIPLRTPELNNRSFEGIVEDDMRQWPEELKSALESCNFKR